ncbi:MAG: permease prefix domain 1-containing protein, partial [bacterium]
MGWISKIGALMQRSKLSAEHDEEVRYHLSRLEDMKMKAGLAPEEARLAAKRRFGNVALVKEEMREADLFTFLESFVQDIRFAVRMLAKYPGFTATAVFALAIGIGANTAVFTAYKAVLLQPLDAKDPGELVNVYRAT